MQLDEWGTDLYELRHGRNWLDAIIFAASATLAVVLFFVFKVDITNTATESNSLFIVILIPAFAIGFLYGMKISSKVMEPSQHRSPLRRSIEKIFLFLFVAGAIFSSVTFALHGGMKLPEKSILDEGLVQWITDMAYKNGNATFLIVSSITAAAAITKRTIGIEGLFGRLFTFVGTFVFFSMIVLSLSHTKASDSQVYLYGIYEAGIVGGVFYKMINATSRQNMWEDFANGY